MINKRIKIDKFIPEIEWILERDWFTRDKIRKFVAKEIDCSLLRVASTFGIKMEFIDYWNKKQIIWVLVKDGKLKIEKQAFISLWEYLYFTGLLED